MLQALNNIFVHQFSSQSFVLVSSDNHTFQCMQAIDAKYAEIAARLGPDQEVMFEEEQITLDIPEEGLVLESGWTITPHTYPGVSLALHSTSECVLIA